MILSLLLAFQAAHVHSTIPLQDVPVSWEVCDVNGDGLRDILFVAVNADTGMREWRYHQLRKDGSFSASPDNVLEIKKDIIAWGVGEFDLSQNGVELYAQTRSAAFVLSPRQSSYAGIKKVASCEMLLDLASLKQMPSWSAIGDVDGNGQDEILLATWTGFKVVDAKGKVLGDIPVRSDARRLPSASASLGGVVNLSANSQPLSDLVIPNEDPGVFDELPVLYVEESMPMPLLADANGDGFLDVLYTHKKELHCHYYRPQSPHFSDNPNLSVRYGESGDWSVSDLQIVAAGGGPAADLLLTRKKDGGLIDAEWQHLLFVDALINDRPFSRPDSLIATEAAWSSANMCRIAGDAKAEVFDIAVSSWELRLQQLGMGGVDIRHVVTLYPSMADGGHDDQAVLRYQRDYSASDFEAFSLVPAVSGDLSGDHRFDLLESDSSGQLEMRSLQGQGTELKFSRNPQFTIPTNALASAVQIEDLNQDGFGDIMLLREGGADFYLTRVNK